MAPNIVFRRIAALLQARMHQHELGSREAASLIGITHTTLIRALKSNSMDLPTVIKLAHWLGVQPSTLLDTTAADPTVAYIASLLELNPQLKDLFCQVENVSPAVAQETLSYMVFRAGIEQRWEERE